MKQHFHNQTRLYERIYRTLRVVLPSVPESSATATHHIDQRVRLRVHTVENHKYTTILNLTFILDAGAFVPDPALTVRIYHDAQVAEVIGFQARGSFRPDYDYPNEQMLHADEKHQVNRLLQEWLDYCLRRGPVLDPAEAAA